MNQACQEMGDGPRPLRVVTYNIHKCRGLDGRVRPERIAGVLGELNADIIALQEVTGGGKKTSKKTMRDFWLINSDSISVSARTAGSAVRRTAMPC